MASDDPIVYSGGLEGGAYSGGWRVRSTFWERGEEGTGPLQMSLPVPSAYPSRLG